ncbi:respiratory nitrate reductase 2 subunit beta [Escherichia coli]|uniref:Respiratory nitrate reductase 2 subunit beta n=1 Tax=Escherichia coli TaxID=562 RepID=A0A377E413_ECOLX|nr:respiratory nitrate reductase 2 subunit beta [Escherichia coli]
MYRLPYCSVTCKNVWTGREGMEYAWFNNVRNQTGHWLFRKNWEDQEEWQGGWVRDVNGKIRPRLGSKMGVITKIFANPWCRRLMITTNLSLSTTNICIAHRKANISLLLAPRSLIDGKRMDKVIWGAKLGRTAGRRV